MARRLDNLPEEILICILDHAWGDGKPWAAVSRPEHSFQRSLLYVNKSFEASVEGWMYSRIRQFRNGRLDYETWLINMLPRPARHLFISKLDDNNQQTIEAHRIMHSIRRVADFLALESGCPSHERAALKGQFERRLCALAAATYSTGNQTAFYRAFVRRENIVETLIELTEDLRFDLEEPCSVGAILATFENNPSLLTRYTRRGPYDVNMNHDFFGNAILVAARMGHVECMEILLRQPKKIFFRNQAGYNALHLAARNGDITVMKMLLTLKDSGLNPMDQGMTAIAFAARNGHLAAVELLLHELMPLPSTDDIDLAFTCAASAGHEDIVKRLWKASSLPEAMKYLADPEDMDEDAEDSEGEGEEDDEDDDDYDFGYCDMLEPGINIGHLAAKNDHVNIVKAVIDSADFNFKTKKAIARSCFRAAAVHNSPKSAELILSRYNDIVNTPIMGEIRPLAYAALLTATDVMRVVLEQDNVDVNHASGVTALCCSVCPPISQEVTRKTNELEALQIMLAQPGVDVNCPDFNGDTPLIWAAIAGDPRMIKTLMSFKELDVNARNHFGESALSRAVLRGNIPVVQALLTREGIQADMRNKKGQSPFQMAAILGHLDIMELLINRADVDAEARDNLGRTALWLAARSGKVEIVRFLMHYCKKLGIDLNHADKDDITPLEIAILGEQGDQGEVIQILTQGKPTSTILNNLDATRKTPSDRFCCIACLMIHPEAHGVYEGAIPGFWDVIFC